MQRRTWSLLLSILTFVVSVYSSISVNGQTPENLFLTIKNPGKEAVVVSIRKQFITGLTCKSCSISVNGVSVRVYSTGTFAYELNFPAKDSIFRITAIKGNRQITKDISYKYLPPVSEQPMQVFGIERIETFPEGDLVLQEGDKIRFRVKALPGNSVSVFNRTPLFEMPISVTRGIAGIYQGEYEIRKTDSFYGLHIPITLISDSGQRMVKQTVSRFSVMSPLASDVAITKGRLAFLEYGIGEDRLGGAKIGYLDSLIPLKIIGKVGTDYKIRLAQTRTAYIDESQVNLLPRGSFGSSSLTENWQVYSDSAYDYVQVSLAGRLPYQSRQLTDPSIIIVDLFGATTNTNWITQLETKEIASLDYEQVADDILRINIRLKSKQHWGHQLYYRGNSLVIKIKQEPSSLSLKGLRIAVDAGHGGTNPGAQGLTGVVEKDLALSVSLKLQKELEKEGAKVIMTRTTEKFFDNKERILFYRDSMPDFLLSVHLNSSTDPLNVGGTMMFYRYPGFRPLSEAIYKRMLELGLKPGGITGSFNFMLNSPTEYPNALIEALFLSNLEEESRIIDPQFQQMMAEKIVAGVKDFLNSISNDKK